MPVPFQRSSHNYSQTALRILSKPRREGPLFIALFPFSLKKQEKLTEPETGDKILRKRRTDEYLKQDPP